MFAFVCILSDFGTLDLKQCKVLDSPKSPPAVIIFLIFYAPVCMRDGGGEPRVSRRDRGLMHNLVCSLCLLVLQQEEDPPCLSSPAGPSPPPLPLPPLLTHFATLMVCLHPPLLPFSSLAFLAKFMLVQKGRKGF